MRKHRAFLSFFSLLAVKTQIDRFQRTLPIRAAPGRGNILANDLEVAAIDPDLSRA
jgi:hypothetical protein